MGRVFLLVKLVDPPIFAPKDLNFEKLSSFKKRRYFEKNDDLKHEIMIEDSLKYLEKYLNAPF